MVAIIKEVNAKRICLTHRSAIFLFKACVWSLPVIKFWTSSSVVSRFEVLADKIQRDYSSVENTKTVGTDTGTIPTTT